MDTNPETASEDLVANQEQADRVPERKKPRQKEELQQLTLEGILPYWSPKLYEMSNALLRTSLFSLSRMSATSGTIEAELELYSVGDSKVTLTGYRLTTEHEDVWTRLLAMARVSGRRVTEEITFSPTGLLRNMGMTKGGKNYIKLERILRELANTQLTIVSPAAIKHLYALLKNKELQRERGGQYLVNYIEEQHKYLLKMLEQGIKSGSDAHISIPLRMLAGFYTNKSTKQMVVNLDPLTALFFDGISTTIVPYEILDSLTLLERKLINFACSHQGGVYAMKLRHYHGMFGMELNYDTSRRQFKSRMTAACKSLTEKGLIHEGWEFKKAKDGEWLLSGVSVTDKVALSTFLEEQTRPVEVIELERNGNDYDHETPIKPPTQVQGVLM